MPGIGRILETSLYVADLPRAVAFYEDLFGFARLFSDDRICAMDVGGQSVLLLLRQGASAEPMEFPGGILPPHDASGRIHFAFAIDADELEAWEQELNRRGIAVESRVNWPRGGASLYFRDPDGHLGELVTPGCWATY